MDTPSALITVSAFRQLLVDQHPFATLLGIDVVDIAHGSSTLILPADPSHTRLGGIIAGPMLMALADLALYAAVVGATGNPQAVTASLSINFMRGAPPGGVVAYANILKTGRLSSGEVRICPQGSDETLAHAISTWSLPRQP